MPTIFLKYQYSQKTEFLAGLFLPALIITIVFASEVLAGSLVRASCPCGFNSGNICIFGGKANHKTYCAFPVYCPGCPGLPVANLYADGLFCPDCSTGAALPYDDPSLIGKDGENVIVSWNTLNRLGRNLEITNGSYLCPACGNYSMRFELKGRWD